MSWVLDDSSSGISDVDLAIAMNDDSGNEGTCNMITD